MHRLCLFAVLVILIVSPLTAATLSAPPAAQPLSSSKIAAVLDRITIPLLRDYLVNLTNIGPRVTGTYACNQAALYIHDQFIASGVQTRYQNFTMFGNKYYPHWYTASNVEATIPGTDSNDKSILIFNAHYDCPKMSVGANDDASGTAAVLAAAYALSLFQFNRTIKLLAVAGEEQGLLGSRSYAKEAYKNGTDILIEFNADMIGHTETTAGARIARLSVTEDAGFASVLAHQVNAGYIDFNLTDRNITRPMDGYGGSDYAAFVNYGWESISVWEGEHDPNMHTPQDDMSNVNLAYLVNTTKLIVGSLAAIADASLVPPQVRLVSPLQGALTIQGRYIKDIDDQKTRVLNDLWLWAEVFHPTQPILKVDFYMDGRLMYSDTTAPYNWHIEKRSIRTHTFSVIAYDSFGRTTSDIREIRYINILKRK